MNNKERVIVYAVGFLLGMLLVSTILTRRAAREEQRVEDPWVRQHGGVLESDFEPLPATVPESIQRGRVLDFGFLPEGAAVEEKVWHLNFDESYPYIRVVENIESGVIEIMTADQILIKLADGVDVTELKPMLDELGLRLRMFNRAERIAVIGVVSTHLDAVPATVAAIQPFAHLFEFAGPDEIIFKKSDE